MLRDSCVSEDGRKRNQHQPFMAFRNLLGFVYQSSRLMRKPGKYVD